MLISLIVECLRHLGDRPPMILLFLRQVGSELPSDGPYRSLVISLKFAPVTGTYHKTKALCVAPWVKDYDVRRIRTSAQKCGPRFVKATRSLVTSAQSLVAHVIDDRRGTDLNDLVKLFCLL